MTQLQIPTFDLKFNFTGYTKVSIKNKPDSKDYTKVASKLPGVACGYCPAIYSIGETKQPIEITRFYDIRQKR